MTFLNPLGLLALVGIPVVLLIHFFQRRRRRIETSTLFLVEETQKEQARGRRLERLRSSPLLWLQLLVVLVLTWVLVEPQWLREDSLQRVVLVVDGSASMTAFREPARDALERYSERVERSAGRTEWIVLGSDPSQPTLYSGTERPAAVRAALDWQPRLGRHDLRPILSLARSIASASGRVILLTDHELPNDGVGGVEIERLAVGSPMDNVGFAGVEVASDGDASRWRAIIKNSGASRQTRALWTESEGSPSTPRSLVLEPGELEFVSGRLEGASLEVVLEEDGFSLDDRLPLLRPRMKPLAVHVSPEAAALDFSDRLLDSLAAVERTSNATQADLILDAGDSPGSLEGTQLFFLSAADAKAVILTGPIVAGDDPIVADLDWRGLLVADQPGIRPAETDRVVLWQGDRPLLLLRPTVGRHHESLLVNFDLERSNADRLPAFVLALHRYLARVRASTVGFEGNNLETRQVVELAVPSSSEEPLVLPREERTEVRPRKTPGNLVRVRLPDRPGFYDVTQDGETLMEVALRFGDLREADLTEARSAEPAPSLDRDRRLKHSRSDPLVAAWLLLLLALVVLGWSVRESGS